MSFFAGVESVISKNGIEPPRTQIESNVSHLKEREVGLIFCCVVSKKHI